MNAVPFSCIQCFRHSSLHAFIIRDKYLKIIIMKVLNRKLTEPVVVRNKEFSYLPVQLSNFR